MSDPLLAEIVEVLARYGLAPTLSTEPRRAGSGFSGADVWRVETAAGSLCVRRWPSEHPNPAKLRGIHNALLAAVAGGCNFVPSPLQAADGNTMTQQHGRLWEVTPWMPGQAVEELPLNEVQSNSLWNALATFHRAFTNIEPLPRRPSPGLAERLRKLDHVVESGMGELRIASVPKAWKALTPRRDEFVHLFTAAVRFVRPPLVVAAGEPAVSIPCIRDIRCEHVLFTEDQVTGWIDFGALDYETPVADVARVLVEFFDEVRSARPTLIAPYEEACRGTLLERCPLTLVDAFVRAGTLLSPWTWLRWILLDGYDFPDQAAVLARLDRLLSRLRRLVETQ